MAATHLERLGYTVLKTATRSLIFDLIAFNEQHTLFISARRERKSQTVKEISQTYSNLIADMQKIRVPYLIEKQFWVYQDDHFEIYKLFDNGIMKKQMDE